MSPQRVRNAIQTAMFSTSEDLADNREVLEENGFLRRIAIERKRTERSREAFVLMILEAAAAVEPGGRTSPLDEVSETIMSVTRETDVIGWYKGHLAMGVMYTGIDMEERNSALSTIMKRVSDALRKTLQAGKLEQINIAFHMFPDDWSDEDRGHTVSSVLYEDIYKSRRARRVALAVKRTLDVAMSLAFLSLLSPLMLVLAVAVKLSSRGPILFRQARIGQYGRSFTFLKFRSMRCGNDSSVHREYMKNLIANRLDAGGEMGQDAPVYKMKNDARVTRIGKFLRRSSLDELPQLFNVLLGDMSLVGPRPPLPYELAEYEIWHRRRLLEAKPGMTGLWQVKGRSRVKFDDMVRMDLEYAMHWTPWLDMKILMQTPRAVITGAGAC